MFWTVVFIYIISILAKATADDPCRFENAKGVIDLSLLAKHDGSPAYPDVIPPSGSNYKYSYNPCVPFSEQPNCAGVAVCQVSVDGKYSFTLGKQESAVWSAGAGLGSSPTISYSEGPKQSIVTLVCGDEGVNDFDALGEGPVNTYKFKLTHKCACWDGCRTPPPYGNCTINGTSYTSDKQIVQSFPFHVSINPSQDQLASPNSNYAQVDRYGNVIELHLFNISTFPSSLFCLSSLKVLSLANSANLVIPSDIGRLNSTLTSFMVSNIASSFTLPSEFFDLTELSTLSVTNSGLSKLPDDISKLSQLSQLILDQNQFVDLPVTLSTMKSLELLSVNNNLQLSSLDSLTGSSSIKTLRGSNCAIDHFPSNISNLQTIVLDKNRLTSLNGIETLRSTTVESFSFAYNKILSVPNTAFSDIKQINQLDLSGNLLTTLPDTIYTVDYIKVLDVHNNNFGPNEIEWIQGVFRMTNTTIII